MSFHKLSFYFSVALSCAFSVVLNVATEIPQGFESALDPVAIPSQTVKGYFVRVDLVPLMVRIMNQEAAGIEVTDESKAADIAEMRSELKKVISEAEPAALVVMSPVVATYVGFLLLSTKDQAASIIAFSQVKVVVSKSGLEKQRAYSTSWIGGTTAHEYEEYDIKGSGQTIAAIDSGIGYFHSDFSANVPVVIEDGSFPTSTVIDGYPCSDRTGALSTTIDVLEDGGFRVMYYALADFNNSFIQFQTYA